MAQSKNVISHCSWSLAFVAAFYTFAFLHLYIPMWIVVAVAAIAGLPWSLVVVASLGIFADSIFPILRPFFRFISPDGESSGVLLGTLAVGLAASLLINRTILLRQREILRKNEILFRESATKIDG
jgi:hypothetical protein